MPDMGKLSYIIGHFGELGKISSNGLSICALSWLEISAYKDVNKIGNWEALIIQAMSRMYVDSVSLFDNEMCDAPYIQDGLDMNYLLMEAATKKLFG